MNKLFWPILVGLALRVLLPWYGHGFRHMDEHWQVIEPANYLVHGVWSRAFEWEIGSRSWIYPWIVSLPLRMAEAIGIRTPIWIVAFIRTLFGLFSTLSIPLAARLAEKWAHEWTAKRPVTQLTAWVIALWPFAVYCGFHTHAEMTAAIFVLAAISCPAFLKKPIAYFGSGIFFGFALALRIDIAIAGLGYGIFQLLNKRLTRAVYLLAGVLPFVVLIGLVDKLTWGNWFHSLTAHARINLIEGVGNQWGVSPWYTHLLYYFDLTSVLGVLSFVGFFYIRKRLPDSLISALFTILFYVGFHCFIPHKEKRFLAPLIYIGLVSSIVILAIIWDDLQKNWSRKKLRLATQFASFLFGIHFCVNAYTYWYQRPWWDRIRAMHLAGQIPNIEKMYSPLWPAVFYLPRNVPSEVIKSDLETLKKMLDQHKRVSIAVDWDKMTYLENIGIHCEGWPTPPPSNKDLKKDPTPWAYVCSR